MYQASFARVPDYGGFEYWAGVSDAQQFSALQLADIFITSPEFTAKFGANPSNSAYVTELYTNVLGRTPDPTGLAYWIAQANAGQPHDQLLVDFATSPENIQTTGPHTAHGYWVT
jgi:serralysin